MGKGTLYRRPPGIAPGIAGQFPSRSLLSLSIVFALLAAFLCALSSELSSDPVMDCQSEEVEIKMCDSSELSCGSDGWKGCNGPNSWSNSCSNSGSHPCSNYCTYCPKYCLAGRGPYALSASVFFSSSWNCWSNSW